MVGCSAGCRTRPESLLEEIRVPDNISRLTPASISILHASMQLILGFHLHEGTRFHRCRKGIKEDAPNIILPRRYGGTAALYRTLTYVSCFVLFEISGTSLFIKNCEDGHRK